MQTHTCTCARTRTHIHADTNIRTTTITPHAPGNSYLKRAILAVVGPGANQPEDAIYPALLYDANGDTLMSPNKYVIKFPNGQLPPVGAFWSVTLYGEVRIKGCI